MEQLAPGVYVESGFTGVTVGAILGPEGILCIDTPTLAVDARKWRHRLSQLSNEPIRMIVNLDHHLDRVLGNQWLDAPVVTSEAAAERIRAYPESFKGHSPSSGADSELAPAGGLSGARIISPQFTFSDRMTIHHGRREIHLLRSPGPNSGAAWVHLPADRIVFAGDTVVVDVPPILAEAETDDWLASLEALKKAPFRNHTLVPGRGRVTDAGELHWLVKYLKQARRKVMRLHERQQDRSALARLIPEFLEYWAVPRASQPHMSLRLQAGLERLWEEAAGGRRDG